MKTGQNLKAVWKDAMARLLAYNCSSTYVGINLRSGQRTAS